MRIRKNDRNNDWTFGNSQNTFFVDNSVAVAQDLKTKIQEWKGDFFANLQAGIDWKTRLGYRGQKAQLDKDLQKIITDNENVISLNSFESYVDGRTYTANFSYFDRFSAEIQEISINVGE